MKRWQTAGIEAMLELVGPRIVLRPLASEDNAALLAAASDGELWNLRYTVVPSAATIDGYVRTAISGRATSTVMPFVTVLKAGGQIIGSTRFWKIDPVNRKLEIGHTWISKSWQRSFVNTEAKYLMLTHAFDVMNCVRVQFTTDELNTASRNAILALGARQEGVVRHERIMPDGRKRNSVRFSIIDDEWPQVRLTLQGRLARTA